MKKKKRKYTKKSTHWNKALKRAHKSLVEDHRMTDEPQPPLSPSDTAKLSSEANYVEKVQPTMYGEAEPQFAVTAKRRTTYPEDAMSKLEHENRMEELRQKCRDKVEQLEYRLERSERQLDRALNLIFKEGETYDRKI